MKINKGAILAMALVQISIVSANISVENADSNWNLSMIPASEDVIIQARHSLRLLQTFCERCRYHLEP